MSWQVEYLPEAVEDLKALNASQRNRVVKAIQKVGSNPFPAYDDAKGRCGYGKPLGNKTGFDLAGLLKIKLRQDGIRVVYKLEEDRGAMKVIIVGMRSDDEVYRLAAKRRKECGL